MISADPSPEETHGVEQEGVFTYKICANSLKYLNIFQEVHWVQND